MEHYWLSGNVNKDYNHPAHIARNLPEAINKRLDKLSSDNAVFDNAKGEYEKALRERRVSQPAN